MTTSEIKDRVIIHSENSIIFCLAAEKASFNVAFLEQGILRNEVIEWRKE